MTCTYWYYVNRVPLMRYESLIMANTPKLWISEKAKLYRYKNYPGSSYSPKYYNPKFLKPSQFNIFPG